jgi:tetratricopeptide (TPR) repeat protein
MDKAKSKHLIIVAVLLLSAAIIPYINTLSNEFVFDDISLIIHNDEIKYPVNFIKYLQRPRGVKFITHIIEYQLWGLNPLPYHVTNILLHSFCTISLYLLLSLLFSGYRIPFIVGLLFATHPVHTEAVAAVSNRNEMLAMFFFIWSFFFYVIKNKNIAFYFLSLCSFTIALFSKEAAVVTLPVLLILYDTLFNKADKKDLIRNARYYLPYGIIIILFLSFIIFVLSIYPKSIEPRVSELFLQLSFPSYTYVACKSFLMYLKLIVLPINLNVEHLLSIPVSFWEWKVLVSLLSLIFFIVITIKMHRLSKAVSFGLAWFFITLLPLLNLIYPLTPYFVAERYLYLPSAGFCLIIGVMLDRIMRANISIDPLLTPIRISILLLAAILCLYSGFTIRRNADWRTSYTLWSKTVTQSPESSRANIGLAHAYSMMGMYLNAILYYERALNSGVLTKRIESLTLNNLGNSYLMIGSVDQAISSYKKAISTYPNNYKAYYNLDRLKNLTLTAAHGVVQ